MKDEFYIGYLDAAPSGIARRVLWFTTGLAVALLLLVSALAARQTEFGPGLFEFGIQREFKGVLLEKPLPMLHVSGPGGVTNYVLVGAGKHGLPAFAQGNHGRTVRFLGSLIERAGQRMIEMNAPDTFAIETSTSTSSPDPHGEPVTLAGELVDTKCYFGVMRPATGKVHRACAIRCLSGGVPPGLLLRTSGDSAIVVLLSNLEDTPGYEVSWAGRAVEIHGRLQLVDGTPILRAESIALVQTPSGTARN